MIWRLRGLLILVISMTVYWWYIVIRFVYIRSRIFETSWWQSNAWTLEWIILTLNIVNTIDENKHIVFCYLICSALSRMQMRQRQMYDIYIFVINAISAKYLDVAPTSHVQNSTFCVYQCVFVLQLDSI